MGAMMIGWLILAALLVGLVFRLVGGGDRASDKESARRILAERYARGKLDTDEYTSRRSALR
jgi:putative membrane protein